MNLDLKNQNSFLEITQPPAGYQLTYCIGTTFTLQIECVVQLAIAARGSVYSGIKMSRPEALETLQRFQERTVIFCQSCRIKEFRSEDKAQFSPEFRSFYRILDDVVLVIPAPGAQGSFHPKVWLLRFDGDRGAEPIFKLVVATRNLTTDMSWDAMVVLHGSQVEASTSRNTAVIQFFSSLLKNTKEHGRKAKKLLTRALSDLRSTEFASPFNAGEGAFDFQWPSLRKFQHLDFSGYESLVVLSPFLSESTVKEAASSRKHFYLVTAEQCLSELTNVKSVWDKTYLMNSEKMGLHAKIYVGRRTKKSPTEIVIGSPNLTVSGLRGGNIEAAYRMLAPQGYFDEFVEGFIQAGEEGGTAPWLNKFDPSMLEQSSDVNQEIEDNFDKIKNQIAQGVFELKYERRVSQVTVAFRSSEEIKVPAGYKLFVRMFGHPEEFQFTELLSAKGIRFRAPLSEVNFFLCIRISKGSLSDEFWTVAEGQLDRRSRNAIVTRHCIDNWNSFLSYLNSLLDLSQDVGGFQTHIQNHDGVAGGRSRRMLMSHQPQILERFLLNVKLDDSIAERLEDALAGLPTGSTEESDREQFELFWKNYRAASMKLKRVG